jgi:hypothetical protein
MVNRPGLQTKMLWFAIGKVALHSVETHIPCRCLDLLAHRRFAVSRMAQRAQRWTWRA